MTEPLPQKTGQRVLLDPWAARGGVPLDRMLERNEFPPFLMAVVGLVVGFVLFQLVGSVAMGIFLAARGVSLTQLVEDFEGVLATNAGEVILANSTGQVLGLGLFALGLAWLHSSRVGSFLRLRRADGKLVGLALLGLAVLLPVVWWLGAVNQSVPLPEWLREIEEQRLQIIEGVIKSDLSLVFNLAMLALTPALCEEVFFRGYVQRQFERSTGAAGGILLSGILFGLYHLSLSQALPLSVLGLYLAYLTWRTGSLWPAMIVHFANNAFSVGAAQAVEARSDISMTDLETMQLPWYIVAGSLVLFAGVVYVLHRQGRALLSRRRGDPGAS